MSLLAPVLYAEDDENDAYLMQRAFKRAEVAHPLCIVSDGASAIARLQDAAKEGRALPCLMLLDLKMPGQSGFDVLKWARSNPETRVTPVLVLTSSNQDSDLRRAYAMGANGYLVKPGTPEAMVAMVKSVKDFWLVQNCAPPPETASSAGSPSGS